MFLKNHWYVAALANEVAEQPLARTILGQPVVLWRTPDGTAVALEDRCCHRRVPLSLGKVVGDNLQCIYHGLEFAASGQCMLVPGQDQVPAGARVTAYPVVERYSWLWIWMGDPALADPATICDFHWFTDPAWGSRSTRLHAKANWQLIVDNLLDLTHLTYVHHSTIGTMANTLKAETSFERLEDGVRVTRWTMDAPPPPSFALVGGFKGNVDRWQIITHSAPSFVRLNVGACDAGTGAREGRREGGINMWNLNAVTPETETTSHYFWGQAHDFSPHDAAVTEKVFGQIALAFQEDLGVLEGQQRMFDFDPSHQMTDIRADAAANAARRLLARMHEEETGLAAAAE
jgi:phenylpropionate dioxygenase-like ring-hydroxylating dioxygenase large terminal subunit